MTIAEHERLPEVTERNPSLEAKLHAMWESEPGLRGFQLSFGIELLCAC